MTFNVYHIYLALTIKIYHDTFISEMWITDMSTFSKYRQNNKYINKVVFIECIDKAHFGFPH